ncbi:cryptochrome-2 isoform X1 [Anastrepha obliqua]|uniref:cryptochrome-2 isoform X1 n=1 Tax=Anastrepha obliqua TaxID=95512 RepID=UPI002409D08D|nr:cryptochrome-2 isoform X1 [Anastrepha obliqua]
MESKNTLVHWFRKGLRVHDNPALTLVFTKALSAPTQYCVRPIFILDSALVEWLRVGANRWRFLQQTLADLDAQLRQINSKLYVVRGTPATVFPHIFREWRVSLLTFETDIEPYALKRDAEVQRLAKEAGVKVDTCCSHTIYNPELVMQRNDGHAPLTYQKFLSVVDKFKVPLPVPKPEQLSDEHEPPKDAKEKRDVNCYAIPSMEELVKRPEGLGENKFPGGESEGLRRLDASLSDESWVVAFEKPNTSPNSLEPSTTVLSPYLKFGCLSARLCHHRITNILSRHKKHSKPPVSLLGQLLWREFYYTAAASEPNFDRMLGNKFCMQIPWESNEAHLTAWAYGRTGYPFIDAIMRQLRKEGWIHHLARHAVACFLTRGDLWISWEEGQKVFEELLLDQDWALNAGNWMWLSASAFFYQYFRVYSPVAFGRKTDPTGVYIRKYVPELAKYPAGCIYEPWKATLSAQREYGCVLGEDYPHRIVNHETVHKENIKRMTAAYKVNREVKQDSKTRDKDDERGKCKKVGTSATLAKKRRT